MFQKSNQLKKQFGIEPAGRQAEHVTDGWICPVRPLACNAEATAFAPAENQRIDTGYTPFLEHFKALASKWMKWMADLRPSQSRPAVKCSWQ